MPGKSSRTTIVSLRLPNDLVDLVRAECERSTHTRKGAPLNVSQFFILAGREKLAHLIRSRRSRAVPKSRQV